MVILAAFAIGWQRPPAEEVLRAVFVRYQKLKSLSVKVIHHADFMSGVKDSTDTMTWLAPKRFELVSDKDSIPKVICDGKHLTTFIPNVVPISEPFDNEPGRSKPWESRGGAVLSCLMRGPLIDQILRPDKPIQTKFDNGSVLHWHDQAVSQIIETMTVHGTSQKITYYLSANHQSLIGTEVTNGTETSSTQYADAVENPEVSKNLGTVVKN